MYHDPSFLFRKTTKRQSSPSRLTHIQSRMAAWASLGKMKSFVNQDIIAQEIATCHNQITDCINTFQVGDFFSTRLILCINCHLQLTSHLEIHEWMVEFQRNSQLDHYQLMESLSQIQESQAILEAQTSATNELVQQMMAMFQKVRDLCS